MKCSIIGLGKLGASMVGAIASRGVHVVGVDLSERCVELINAGQAPVPETSLGETIGRNRERIRATMSYLDAVLDSDVTLVVVPTPTDERGAFSLEYAAAAFEEVGKVLKEKNTYHTVVLCSTVLPGSIREGLIPVLEEASGKTCGRDFGLCYSPAFIALGSVIKDFLNPDFTLVGEFDKRSGDTLERFYETILENGAPCRRMSVENAELAKVAINTFVTTKITFANMLAQLCERLPGGDVDVVTDALGLDVRIGRSYLKGALGYGGPCFPRDNVALSFFARQVGLQPILPEATDEANRRLVSDIVHCFREELGEASVVAVLGLAYKPETHVVEESHSIMIAEALAAEGHRIVAHDPMAGDEARGVLQGPVTVVDSLAEALGGADVVLVTTPDPAFRGLRADDFLRGRKAVTVIDFWRALGNDVSAHPRIRYRALGRSDHDEQNALRLKRLWGLTTAESV